MLTPFQEYSFRFLRLIQIVGSARPHFFIDKFINIRPTQSGKLRAIFALSFPTMSYIYKFIDRALHQPTQKYPSVTDGPQPILQRHWFYIGRRADDATTLISRPRALVVSRWIYYDLMSREAVLLEGCEHAEDLTASVKSSACSHPSRSTASASSGSSRS